MFAKMRREFHIMEGIRGAAGPDGGGGRVRGARPLPVCIECGTGLTCPVCGACGSCGAARAGPMGSGRRMCYTCGTGGACDTCGVCDVCGACGTEAARPHAAADVGLDANNAGATSLCGATPGRAPGHQPGVWGTSHGHRPDPGLAVEFMQRTCGLCGRTDTGPGTSYKTVTEVVGGAIIGDGLDVEGRIRRTVEYVVQREEAGMGESRRLSLAGKIASAVAEAVGGTIVHYAEKTTYADCYHCVMRTYPDGAHTIPGSSFGPNLRAILASMHRMMPAVRSIAYGLSSNHDVEVSIGSVSNCLTAMAEYSKHGSIRKISPAGRTAPHGPGPHRAARQPGAGRSPCPPQDKAGHRLADHPDCRDGQHGTARDIRRVRREGGGWAALVIRTIRAIHIVIRPDRSKPTIRAEFWMVLPRPAVADMYRGGNALKGPFQACGIRLDRKAESLAVRAGANSPEYVLYRMLLDVYGDMCAADIITAVAGGPDRTACDIGSAFRRVPGLAECAASVREGMMRRLAAIAGVYRTGDVVLKESRKMATSVCNAAPHLCMCLDHPGMPGHSNDVERTGRQYLVRPRNVQRALPNRRAAETLGALQTIHANAALLSITSGERVSCRNGPRDLYHTGVPPLIFGRGAAA